VTRVIAATSSAACPPLSPMTSTAPRATAASHELGAVEISREVQERA
jgi:hypothetical protein